MTVIKTQMSLRLDPIILAKIRKISEEDTRSVANMIEYIIKQKIKAYENINGEIKLTDEEIYTL